MIIYLSPLVMLAGLVLFLASTNAKVARAGELMFFAGMFVFLLHTSGGHAYRLP